jgi:DNA replication protein DnaC
LAGTNAGRPPKSRNLTERTLLADRYEKATTMITSNLPFSGWEKIFKDPMTTAAAVDRLVHHSVIIELNLTSYRLEEAIKEKDL